MASYYRSPDIFVPDGDFATAHQVGSRAGLSMSVGGTSGRLHMRFFTAYKTITVSKMSVCTGSTASGATPTLQRMGLFTVDSADAATLVARTASDTAIFAVTNTEYEKAFDTTGGYPATYTLQRGSRYAVGVLIVSGAAIALLAAEGSNTGPTGLGAYAPRTCGYHNGQTDIATTAIASASLTNSTNHFWAKLTT